MARRAPGRQLGGMPNRPRARTIRTLNRIALGAALWAVFPLFAVAAQGAPDKPVASTPAAADVDPAGSYDLTVMVQGSPTPATMSIVKQTDGTLGGTVKSPQGAFPITSVKVAGNDVTVTIGLGNNGDATIRLTLDGDAVTGDWSMSNDGSKITGKKREKAAP